MTTEDASPRLRPLDALRGLAALVVVLFHYRHFGGDAQTYPGTRGAVMGWLCGDGDLFVDLFFLLSGTVLTHKYLDALVLRRLDARTFFALRFSRVYPLYLVTLLFCASLDWRAMALKLPALIYGDSDLYHFVLNLFLVEVGFAGTFSFNGPSWSIATEVLAYIAFFSMAYGGGRLYVARAIGVCAVGLAIIKLGFTYPFVNELVARTMLGFFGGSLLFIAARRAAARGYATHVGVGCAAALLALGLLTPALNYDAFVGTTRPGLFLVHDVSFFPLVILASLYMPGLSHVLSVRPLTLLGDISYAVYMLHVPLQMTILAVLRGRGVDPPIADPRFLGAFLAALVLLAAVTHLFFELPARRWLRSRLVPRLPVSAPGGPGIQEEPSVAGP
jgi:peptidoglycan/LPS O-acetylase OafA/YrhL